MTVDKIKILLEIREEGRQIKTGGKRERMMKGGEKVEGMLPIVNGHRLLKTVCQ